MKTTISAIDCLREAIYIASNGGDLTSALASIIGWEERFKSFQVDSHLSLSHSEFRMIKGVLTSKLIPFLKDFKKLQLPIDFLVRAIEFIKMCLLFKHDNEEDVKKVEKVSLEFETVLALRQLGLSLFTLHDAAKVKLLGLNLLYDLFGCALEEDLTENKVEELNLNNIIKTLFNTLTRSGSKSPTLKQSINQLLGRICQSFSRSLSGYEDQVQNALLSQLQQQINSTASKVEMPIVEGCFRGLTSTITAFNLRDEERKSLIYEALLKCCVKPEDSGKRTAYRAALDLFSVSAKNFIQHFLDPTDAQHWFNTLTTWALSSNSDDRKIGWRALNTFLKTIGYAFSSESESNKSAATTFKYFIGVFTQILKNNQSTSQECTIAVQGYSHLAPAAKKYLNNQDVTMMLSQLILKTEEVFVLGEESFRGKNLNDVLVYLPNYIQSITNILRSIDESIPSPNLLILKQILLFLIKMFPYMPKQYHQSSWMSFLSIYLIFKEREKSGILEDTHDFLTNIIYQGILLTCSHPMIIESEEDLIETGEIVVSVSSYTKFWLPMILDHHVSNRSICDSIIACILQIIERLNFSTETIEVTKELEQELDHNEVVCIKSNKVGDNTEKDDTPSVSKVSRPVVMKDFTILANLVQFCEECVFHCTSRCFKQWIFHFALVVMRKSTKFPEISGLYKLFSLCLHTCDTLNYFCDNINLSQDDTDKDDTIDSTLKSDVQCCSLDHRNQTSEKILFIRYLEEVLKKCGQFINPDLLKSCLQMLFALPISFVPQLLSALKDPFKRIFSIGQNYLHLAERGVGTLTIWHEKLGEECLEELLIAVVPKMKDFLHESQLEIAESSSGNDDNYELKKRGKQKSALKTMDKISDNSSVYNIQVNILFFFGALDPKLHYLLLPNDDDLAEIATSWDLDKHLKFAIPFPDSRPEIYLDTFLPRTVFLALNARDRRTRVSACEFLHVSIIFLLGKSATQTQEKSLISLYKNILPAVVKLAGDEDQVIQNLFQPLLTQTIHWLTKSSVGNDRRHEETMCLLDCILESLCDPEDSTLRLASAKHLQEYLKWSIKQKIPSKHSNHHCKIDNVKNILKRMYSMWTHPSPLKRYAASLAFNNFYTIFREEESLIDQYILEITVHAMQSLAIQKSETMSGVVASNVNPEEETNECLVHVTRILSNKSQLLSQNSTNRKEVKELEGGVLSDLVEWLISWTFRPETEARHKAMEIIYQITPSSHLKDVFRKYLEKRCNGRIEKFLELVQSCNMPNKKGIQTYPTIHQLQVHTYATVIEWLLWLTSSFECFFWLLDIGLINNLSDEIWNSLSLWKSLEFFIHTINNSIINNVPCVNEFTGSNEILTPSEVSNISKNICYILIRMISLFDAISKNKTVFDQTEEHWNTKDFWRVVIVCFVSPTSIGFDIKDVSTKEGLEESLGRFMDNYTKRIAILHVKFQAKLGKIIDELPPSLQFETLIHSQRWSYNLVDYMHGLNRMRKQGIINRNSNIIISIRSYYDECFTSLLTEDLSPIGLQFVPKLLDLILCSSEKKELEMIRVIEALNVWNTEKGSKRCQNLKYVEGVILNNIDERLDSDALFDDIISRCRNPNFFINLTQYFLNNDVSKSVCLKWVKKFVDNFERLYTTTNEMNQKETMDALINLIKHLLILEGKINTRILQDNKSIFQWHISILKAKDHSLKTKKKAIDVLSAYLKTGECVDQEQRNEDIKKALTSLSDQNFPLTSTEHQVGSSAHLDYMLTFEKLCKCLEKSSSVIILKFLIEVTCREESHAAMERIKQALKVVVTRTNVGKNKTIELLDCTYMMQKYSNIPSNVRKTILENFLLSMLSHSSTWLIKSFYLKNIESILNHATLIQLHGTETERLESMTLKISSLKLIATLYAKASKEIVHSQSSQLSEKVFHFLKEHREISREAIFNGKEMSQFLVKRLKKIRAEIIDGSSDVKELFRICQCEAFNSMMAVISCIQDQEKFYNAFIFKEDVGSSELIWERIVDHGQEMNFPLETEDFSQRRKKVVAIRNVRNTADEMLNLTTENLKSRHYLSDSSLSQDVVTFDFHDSFSSLQSASQEQEDGKVPSNTNEMSSESMNVVEIEIDSLNDHECMSHLISVIRYMHDKEMYLIPRNEEERRTSKLPTWMQSIKSKLMDPTTTERNIKLLLLRLILNSKEIFLPFTSHFLKDLLSLITTKNMWPKGKILNYFFIDVTVMLLSWSEATDVIPNVSLMERSSVTSLFEQLLKGLEHPRRDIFRYILDIIRVMVELWGSCIHFDYSIIHKLFSKTSFQNNSLSPSESNLPGLQLLGILVTNQMEPYSTSTAVTKEVYFEDLVRNVGSTKKHLYSTAGELIGLILEFYDRKENKEMLELVFETTVTKMKELKKIGWDIASTRTRWIDCLYCCYKRYPCIVNSFANFFIYGLSKNSKVKGECLTQCLEMMQGTVDYLRNQVVNGTEWKQEIGMIELDYFLSHPKTENQLAALNVTEKIIQFMDLEREKEVLSMLFDCLSLSFVNHPSSTCRQKMYSIMRWIWNAAAEPCLLNLKQKTQSVLMQGLGDHNADIVEAITNFFNNSFHFEETQTSKRIVDVFEHLLHSECENSFLHIFPDLILSTTEKSAEFQRKIYEDPLEECIFQDQHINTSWRKRHADSSITPMWVETLSSLSSQLSSHEASLGISQSSTSMAEGDYTGIRATQISGLAFQPTQQNVGHLETRSSYISYGATQGSLGSLSNSTQRSSLSRFKQNQGFGQEKLIPTQEMSQRYEKGENVVILLGKRFAKSNYSGSSSKPQVVSDEWMWSKSTFSRLHARKEKQREQIERDRKGRRFAQVTLMRKYRIGELPDIQISHADVLKPLKNLCYRDAQMSRQLVINLCLSIASSEQGEKPIEDEEQFAYKLSHSLFKVLDTKINNRILVSTCIELLQKLDTSLHGFSVESLVSNCKKLQLESLALLLLEKRNSKGFDVSIKHSSYQPTSSKRAKRVKTDQDECGGFDDVMGMVSLYNSLGDFSSARGLYMQELSLDTKTPMKVKRDMARALNLESLRKWKNAQLMYENLLRDVKDNNSSPSTDQFLKERYFHTLEVMCKWKEIVNETNDMNDNQPQTVVNKSGWERVSLFPLYVNANLHLIVEDPSSNNGLFTVIDDLRKGNEEEKKMIEEHFPFELAKMFLQQDKISDAEFWFDKTVSYLLKDWRSINYFSMDGGRNLVNKIRRCSQMKDYFRLRNKNYTFMSHMGNSIINLWTHRKMKFQATETLQQWDDFISDQIQFIKKIMSAVKQEENTTLRQQERQKDASLSITQKYLRLCHFGQEKKCIDYSKRTLALARREFQKQDFSSSDIYIEDKFEYASTCVLKCKLDVDLGLPQRFNALYRTFMEVEHFRMDPKMESMNESQYMKIKTNAADGLSLLVSEMENKNEKSFVSLLASMLSKEDKKNHFLLLVGNAKTKSDILKVIKHRMLDLLKETIGKIETGKASSSKLLNSEQSDIGQIRFNIASINYGIWNDLGEKTVNVAESIVSNHLLAMKEGNKMARKLFPNLLSWMEEAIKNQDEVDSLVQTVVDTFCETSAKVPSWMFLQWRNQILSVFSSCENDQLVSAIGPLLLNMSESYPEALCFSLQFTKKHSAENLCSPVLKSYLDRLEEKLQINDLLRKVVKEVGNVSIPELKAYDFLKEVLKSQNWNKIQRLITTFMEEFNFNSIRKENKEAEMTNKFVEKYKKKFLNMFENVHRKDLKSFTSKGSELLNEIGKALRDPKSLKYTTSLSDYSPFLSSFHKSSFFETIEIFDQYKGDVEPNPSCHIKMASFSNKVNVFSSLRKPIKLTITGDNGRTYEYIVKYGEDLRQDERIQQVYRLCNKLLESTEYRDIRPLRTYSVVPLSKKLGIIEFIPETTTYKSLAVFSSNSKNALSKYSQTGCLVKTEADFAKVINDSEKCGKVFRSFVDQELNGSKDLVNSFKRLSNSPEGYFYLRKNFVISHAQLSIVSWIMSIGDRHADNSLISKRTGDEIAIDFGHAFGSAFFLPIPELLPFRFTPGIQSLLLPFKNGQGLMRDVMIHTLQSLRENESVLLATLSTFIREPTIDWLNLANTSAAKNRELSTSALFRDYALRKIEIVKKKLKGIHPIVLALEELVHGKGKQYSNIAKIQEALLGGNNTIRRRLKKTYDSGSSIRYFGVDEICDCLLEWASDDNILATSYFGWNPWF